MMNMIYEVYSGPRLLQAEQVTSRPVTCSKGILAGCPAAIDPCASAGPFQGTVPQSLHRCTGCLHGFDVLQQGLTDAGLQMSLTKTGYLASSNDCKKELSFLSTSSSRT